MAYKQQQYIPAKTYCVQTTAIYSCQDLMAYKQQQYIPAKTYGI